MAATETAKKNVRRDLAETVDGAVARQQQAQRLEPGVDALHPLAFVTVGDLASHFALVYDPRRRRQQLVSRTTVSADHPAIQHAPTTSSTQCTVTDRVKVARPTRHEIGHFEGVLPSQSLGVALKKLKLTRQKQTTQQNGLKLKQ